MAFGLSKNEIENLRKNYGIDAISEIRKTFRNSLISIGSIDKEQEDKDKTLEDAIAANKEKVAKRLDNKTTVYIPASQDEKKIYEIAVDEQLFSELYALYNNEEEFYKVLSDILQEMADRKYNKEMGIPEDPDQEVEHLTVRQDENSNKFIATTVFKSGRVVETILER